MSARRGVKLLTIKDLAEELFSVHDLFEAEYCLIPINQSIDLQITESNVIIAAHHFEKIDNIKKLSIKLMEVDIAHK
jgi:hypothetical protein